MALRNTAYYDLGTLDAANEYTPMIWSGDFRNAIFTIIAASSLAGTIKFYSSNSETRPSLGSAASSSNEYATVQVVRLANGNPVDGDTGIVYTGAEDGIIQVEINENGNKWLGVKMTARAAGSVTLRVDFYDNN